MLHMKITVLKTVAGATYDNDSIKGCGWCYELRKGLTKGGSRPSYLSQAYACDMTTGVCSSPHGEFSWVRTPAHGVVRFAIGVRDRADRGVSRDRCLDGFPGRGITGLRPGAVGRAELRALGVGVVRFFYGSLSDPYRL